MEWGAHMATLKGAAPATEANASAITRWIAGVGLLASMVAALLLTVVLVGDVAILVFAYTPSTGQLTVLRVGPPVALGLGTISSSATWYHWLRLLAHWLFRKEQPNVPKEAEGLAKDELLGVPGGLDQHVRQHGRERRGCRSRLRGCNGQIALSAVVGGVIVTVATLGPGPVRVLAEGPFGMVSPTPISSMPTPSPTPSPTVAPQGTITEFPLSQASVLNSIAAGPDGALWFTEQSGNKIGRITPNGAITEFALPEPTSMPCGIIAGPDGNLWFAESSVTFSPYTVGTGRIGRITPTGAITEFTTPTPKSGPCEMMLGADGNVWFLEDAVNQIGRITPNGRAVEFPLPHVSLLGGIAVAPDGDFWFTEEYANQADAIGRITTSGAITEFTLPMSGGQPDGITAGPDGALWFTELSGNKIGRMTTSGAVTEFTIPTPDSRPGYIAAGPDGALWFTEYANAIGRITVSGAITEFPIPTPKCDPFAITAGPDGNLWFTEGVGNKIGRITTGMR
jgi:streptogramin lyase